MLVIYHKSTEISEMNDGEFLSIRYDIIIFKFIGERSRKKNKIFPVSRSVAFSTSASVLVFSFWIFPFVMHVNGTLCIWRWVGKWTESLTLLIATFPLKLKEKQKNSRKILAVAVHSQRVFCFSRQELPYWISWEVALQSSRRYVLSSLSSIFFFNFKLSLAV